MEARAARCLYVPSKADVPLFGGKVIIQMIDELSGERLYKGKNGKNYTHENTLRKERAFCHRRVIGLQTGDHPF
jgi:hypothetical protein